LNPRTIASRLAAWLLTFMLSTGASAQLVEGRDYLVINPPQNPGAGKTVEVIEFFWYACPHCNSLQPSLRAWLKRKPADVEFRRIPAAFRESWLQLARTYYAIEAMGLVDKLHHDVFEAIHEKRTLDPKALLSDPAPLFDWVAAKGVDRQKFADG
jgi:thiol:disulfide interchange protein DsbA